MRIGLSRRRLTRIASVLLLLWSLAGFSGAGRAQAIVSATFNSATGAFTAVDSAGNTYAGNFATFNPSTVSTVPITFTPAGGAPEPAVLTLQPVGPSQFLATGTLPNELALSCTVNAAA